MIDTNTRPPLRRKRGADDPESLTDMQQELRILLPGSQILTAFLVLLPFNQGFERIRHAEKLVYLASFACSIVSLILFSAPAARHRIERPLIGQHRVRYKESANRLIIAGLILLMLGLALVTHLAIAEVVGGTASTVGAIAVLLLTGVVWWLPSFNRKRSRQGRSGIRPDGTKVGRKKEGVMS